MLSEEIRRLERILENINNNIVILKNKDPMNTQQLKLLNKNKEECISNLRSLRRDQWSEQEIVVYPDY